MEAAALEGVDQLPEAAGAATSLVPSTAAQVEGAVCQSVSHTCQVWCGVGPIAINTQHMHKKYVHDTCTTDTTFIVAQRSLLQHVTEQGFFVWMLLGVCLGQSMHGALQQRYEVGQGPTGTIRGQAVRRQFDAVRCSMLDTR